jgi:DNA-binding GntR family transcriptional regulator
MLSVSATPVREAIRRLEQEGLIERRGSRSLAVHDSRPSADQEFALIEASLKAVAIRLAATNATPAELRRAETHLDEADAHRDEMQRLVDSGGPYPEKTAELLLLSLRSFHSELEGACGNAVLLRMLSTVNAFSFRHRVSLLRHRVTTGQVDTERYGEHRQIFDAVAAGDADEAERLMAHHARVAALDHAEPPPPT